MALVSGKVAAMGLALAGAVGAAGYAGGFFSSAQTKLIDIKVERNQLIYELYTEYGSSLQVRGTELRASEILVEAVKNELVTTPGEVTLASGLADLAGSFMKMTEECQFRIDCRAVGRGDNVAFFTSAGRSFFAQKPVVERCRLFAEMEAEIEHLSEKLEMPRDDDCETNPTRYR